MLLRGELQVLVPDHVDVQQRFDTARRPIGAPLRGKPAAAVGVVVVSPAHERFFAVKKHQPHVVFEGARGEQASQRKKKARRGAAHRWRQRNATRACETCRNALTQRPPGFPAPGSFAMMFIIADTALGSLGNKVVLQQPPSPATAVRRRSPPVAFCCAGLPAGLGPSDTRCSTHCKAVSPAF